MCGEAKELNRIMDSVSDDLAAQLYAAIAAEAEGEGISSISECISRSRLDGHR